MNIKFKFQAQNAAQGILALVVILTIVWFLGSAFVGLVGDIYHFLDGFMWAFFAGIVALWAAVIISMIVIYITVVSISLSAIALIGIMRTFQ